MLDRQIYRIQPNTMPIMTVYQTRLRKLVIDFRNVRFCFFLFYARANDLKEIVNSFLQFNLLFLSGCFRKLDTPICPLSNLVQFNTVKNFLYNGLNTGIIVIVTCLFYKHLVSYLNSATKSPRNMHFVLNLTCCPPA